MLLSNVIVFSPFTNIDSLEAASFILSAEAFFAAFLTVLLNPVLHSF